MALLVSACTPTASVEKTWTASNLSDKRDLEGVLVYTAANNEDGRRAFEEEFTQALKAKGVNAVASYTLMPGTEITREDVAAMAAEAEVDTVLVTLFAGRDDTAVLHPGRKYYGLAPVYGGGYYGRGRIYGVPYQVGQTQDFWAEHTSVHLTAKLYEVATAERLWEASAGIEETDDIAQMRSAFIDAFMGDLASHGIAK